MSRSLGKLFSLLPPNAIDTGLRVLRHFRIRKGTHVYDQDWDVLVILDACRYDMYRDIVGEGDRSLSIASTSTEWMDLTFDSVYDSEVANTAYVSANPYSQRLDESRFGLVDHVWQDCWDDDLGTIPAPSVTDRGIAVARSGEFDRIILHYMQPHFPFIGGSNLVIWAVTRSISVVGRDRTSGGWSSGEQLTQKRRLTDTTTISDTYSNR